MKSNYLKKIALFWLLISRQIIIHWTCLLKWKLDFCMEKIMISVTKLGIICLCLLMNVSQGRRIIEKSQGPIQVEDLGPLMSSEEFGFSRKTSTNYIFLISFWMDITLTYCFKPPALYLIIFLTVALCLFSGAIYGFLWIFFCNN